MCFAVIHCLNWKYQCSTLKYSLYVSLYNKHLKCCVCKTQSVQSRKWPVITLLSLVARVGIQLPPSGPFSTCCYKWASCNCHSAEMNTLFWHGPFYIHAGFWILAEMHNNPIIRNACISDSSEKKNNNRSFTLQCFFFNFCKYETGAPPHLIVLYLIAAICTNNGCNVVLSIKVFCSVPLYYHLMSWTQLYCVVCGLGGGQWLPCISFRVFVSSSLHISATSSIGFVMLLQVHSYRPKAS